MGNYAIEALYWELANNSQVLDEFNKDPESVMKNYNLTDAEKALIKDHDVRALAAQGVEQMLLFTSWIAMRGFDQVPEYMRRLNTPG